MRGRLRLKDNEEHTKRCSGLAKIVKPERTNENQR